MVKRILADRLDRPLHVFHYLSRFYKKDKAGCQSGPFCSGYDYVKYLTSKVYTLFFGADRGNRPPQMR
jgi:hypothetical protein